jgi:hypothetical protein
MGDQQKFRRALRRLDRLPQRRLPAWIAAPNLAQSGGDFQRPAP